MGRCGRLLLIVGALVGGGACGPGEARPVSVGGPAATVDAPGAPRLVSSTPAAGAVGVQRNVWLRLEFSAPVVRESLSVRVVPSWGKLGTFYGSAEDTVFVAALESLAAQRAYEVTVSARTAGGAELPPATLEFSTGDDDAPLPPFEASGKDVTAPSLVSSSPAAGAVEVAPDANVSLRFSEPMDAASVEAAFSVSPDLGCAFEWSAEGDALTCVPTFLLAPLAAYEVKLSAGAKDRAGNAFAAPVSFVFTTRLYADTVPPAVAATRPAKDELGVMATQALTLRFSEPMERAATEAAVALTSDGPAVGIDARAWSDDGAELTLSSVTPWPFGAKLTLQVSTGARDLAGNALSEPVAVTFQVIRRSTAVLPSQASLDGFVTSAGVVNPTAAQAYLGDLADNLTQQKAFFSFDLSSLPADAVAVESASLQYFQAAVTGSPFIGLGAPTLESVAYGEALGTGAFTTAALPVDLGLLPAGDVGAKSKDVTPAVRADLQQRVQRGNRSQFRLSFPTAVFANGAVDRVGLATAEATAVAQRPTLQVVYLHP